MDRRLFLHGHILDLGCGLGNLSIEAARRGCTVICLDASATAVDHINKTAASEGLAIRAETADLTSFRIEEDFDAIVSIGLLMFMTSSQAGELVQDIRSHVKPEGAAIVNVLTELTTYLGMFEPGHYLLFGIGELEHEFSGWRILELRHDSFDAPRNTVKVFDTIVTR
ncbi:MAG TPA: class I SAM-dependent methyltransferase [Blastocatellia bacterium]|nr:class I SAM-dependent methyltransferase [Blastocatellia bacterium]